MATGHSLFCWHSIIWLLCELIYLTLDTLSQMFPSEFLALDDGFCIKSTGACAPHTGSEHSLNFHDFSGESFNISDHTPTLKEFVMLIHAVPGNWFKDLLWMPKPMDWLVSLRNGVLSAYDLCTLFSFILSLPWDRISLCNQVGHSPAWVSQELGLKHMLRCPALFQT